MRILKELTNYKQNKDCVEAWYVGFLTALEVLRDSLEDLKAGGMTTFSTKDVEDMLNLSRRVLERSYSDEFQERTLN